MTHGSSRLALTKNELHKKIDKKRKFFFFFPPSFVSGLNVPKAKADFKCSSHVLILFHGGNEEEGDRTTPTERPKRQPARKQGSVPFPSYFRREICRFSSEYEAWQMLEPSVPQFFLPLAESTIPAFLPTLLLSVNSFFPRVPILNFRPLTFFP